jgi:peptidoglycan/LPS O-acetylase OafA/YrhL
MRRLPILNGIAALMVVLNHTVSYGFNAMFFWTDRYKDVSVPTFEAIGTLPYYFLFAIHHLAEFAIPAFLFVSGFFLAFTAKGNSEGINSDLLISRIKKLIAPFIIWSIIVNVLLLRRLPPTIDEVLRMYYYIPLIAQYYLLSPIIVAIAKKRWFLLLIGSAFLQIGVEIITLLQLLEIGYPGQNIFVLATPVWFFPGRLFYFSIGVLAGLYQQKFFDWVRKYQWIVLASMLALLVLSILEYLLVSQLTGIAWLVPHFSGGIKALFATSLVICFFAFPDIKVPFTKELSDLGGKSLGIYLVNTPAIYLIAYSMYFITPWALGNQIVYQSVLIAAGLGIPLLMMEVLRKPSIRKFYTFILG